jgi:hypothetical protein
MARLAPNDSVPWRLSRWSLIFGDGGPGCDGYTATASGLLAGGVGEGLSVADDEVAFDRDRDLGEAAVAGHFAESAFGFEHPGGGPSHAHFPGAPVLDVALDDPDGSDHRFARVRRLEHVLELPDDPEPDHGQRLFHPFPQGGASAGMPTVEFGSEPVELLQGAVMVVSAHALRNRP